jgi:hypothetical protein
MGGSLRKSSIQATPLYPRPHISELLFSHFFHIPRMRWVLGSAIFWGMGLTIAPDGLGDR